MFVKVQAFDLSLFHCINLFNDFQEAKEQTAVEIQKRKDEWERTKAGKESPKSKQIPSVVETLQKSKNVVEAETKVVACSSNQ